MRKRCRVRSLRYGRMTPRSFAITRGRASFKTYLARVVHRDCLDFLRKKNRRRRKVERQFDAYIVSGPKGVEEQVGRKLDIEMLLDQLGPKEKALAKLIYYEGLSSEEVAVIFSTKPTTVDVWHFPSQGEVAQDSRGRGFSTVRGIGGPGR